MCGNHTYEIHKDNALIGYMHKKILSSDGSSVDKCGGAVDDDSLFDEACEVAEQKHLAIFPNSI